MTGPDDQEEGPYGWLERPDGIWHMVDERGILSKPFKAVDGRAVPVEESKEWVENEQHPDLGTRRVSRAKLFEVVQSAGLYPIDQRPTQLRSTLSRKSAAQPAGGWCATTEGPSWQTEPSVVELAGTYWNHDRPARPRIRGSGGGARRAGRGGRTPIKHSAERARPMPSMGMGLALVELPGIEPVPTSCSGRRIAVYLRKHITAGHGKSRSIMGDCGQIVGTD